MTTIAIDTAQKTYYLSSNTNYKITGVTTLQNRGQREIWVCENEMDTLNKGWILQEKQLIRVDSGTLYIDTKGFSVEVEAE